MDALHQLEILWMQILQSLGTAPVEPLKLFSMLGYEEFYMLVMPTIYWCIDGALGIRLAVMLLLSQGTNHIFKLMFHSPRPYWISKDIKIFTTETAFGLPSGHAQSAASIWGLIAATTRSAWGKAAVIAVIFLIGFSRIYLGMHFISDVLAGWLIGAVMLWIYLKIERPLVTWLKQRSLRQLILLVAASTLLLGGTMLFSAAAMSSWQMPTQWLEYATAAQPDVAIDPIKLDGAFTISGTWFGMMLGVAWLFHRQGGYNAAGTSQQRLLRYLIGVAGILVFWFILGSIFPREANALSYTLRFLRYTLIGLWVSVLAPLLFMRMGLCSSSKKEFDPLSTPGNPL